MTTKEDKLNRAYTALACHVEQVTGDTDLADTIANYVEHAINLWAPGADIHE